MDLKTIFQKTRLARLVAILAILTSSQLLYAQGDRKHLREGNRDYRGGKYNDSELNYLRATELPKSSPDSWFSLGNAKYKQQRYDDAATTYQKNASMYDDNLRKSNSFYNLGNAFLGAQKIEESIDAYKNSLRLNPGNLEAKYNLAYAQDLLQQQKEQEQEQQNDENKDDQKDDQKDDKKEGDQQQNEDQKQQDKQQKEDDMNQKQNSGQTISQDDARRLLEALAADEKKVQDKVLKDKAAAAMVRTVKNW
jgi:Ca-activated chloride channel homolog